MPFPTYEKKDQIPAGAEDVYEEKDGKFVPKVPGQADLDAVKTTLEKVRGEKKDADKAARDATEARDAAVRERDALKTQVGDPDAKVAELLKKFDADVAAVKLTKDKEIEALSGRLRTLQLDDQAKAAFVKAGGRAERADAALKLARERLDLAEDRIVVKDAKGEVTSVSVADFWAKEFAKEMPEMFKGTEAGGGGAPGAGGAGSGAGGLSGDAILANPGLAFEAANRAA